MNADGEILVRPDSHQPTSTAAKMHILIVSHDPHVQKTIVDRLSSTPNYQLTVCSTAKKALHTLRGGKIDVLLGDVDTPDLDGWRLSRLVRSGILKCPVDTPIIMVSSTWCERIAEVTAREYGVNEMLPLEHIERIPQVVDTLYQKRTAALPKTRLLIVEDQQDTSDLITRVLGNAFDIEVASDGEQGLNMWRENRHDLVLLDFMLPKRCGRDVLIEIMKDNPSQAVVMMTAHASGDQAEELMLLGAADFIPKPFRPEQLRKVCNIAALREDYLISNQQFASRVQSIKDGETAYKELYETHYRLLDDLHSVVMGLDEQLNITFLNRAWTTLTGHSIESSLGQSLENYIDTEQDEDFPFHQRRLKQVINQTAQKYKLELCLKHHNGDVIWTELKVSHSSAVDQKSALTVCLDNITERKHAQRELEHLAMHDALTGLYNRHYFESSLEQLANLARREQSAHGLVYIDLDYFKVINDTFGHHRGDEVLREISRSLQKRVRKSDILCRLGGDEFAILLHDVDEKQMRDIANDIQSTVGNCSFQLEEQRVHLGSSIGLSLIDGSANLAEEYLKQADIALYVAKGRGRNIIHLYSANDRESEEMRHNINWAQKIRHAIDDDRILLFFQPIVDVKRHEASHYEALVRYKDINGDIVGPVSFIPALENTGDMQILDRHVIQLAIRTLKQYPQLPRVAVNLSAQTFQDESLVPHILDCLSDAKVDAQRLSFELTESASLFNLNITRRVISELHGLGCKFSVDDFGSGFSSFSYLKQLPADYIKLDGSFIKNLHTDDIDRALVKSIVQVIQALGKQAIAEYVENQEILDLLKGMGIDLVQGYHIGYPEPIEKVFSQH